MFPAQKTKGFTLIELLVVVAIIALLVGIMVPVVQNALDQARDTVVKTELKSLELGLTVFKSDFGDYPSSNDAVRPGAQLLSDALAGRTLRGYVDPDTDEVIKDPYVEVGAIEFEDFDPDGATNDDEESYVMKCKWQLPILYYAAAEGAKPTWDIDDIYNADDNSVFFTVYEGGAHRNYDESLARWGDADVVDPPGGDYVYGSYGNFYNFIVNPNIPLDADTESPAPYKVDSFLLISAGKDQKYGTDDDVTNFK